LESWSWCLGLGVLVLISSQTQIKCLGSQTPILESWSWRLGLDFVSDANRAAWGLRPQSWSLGLGVLVLVLYWSWFWYWSGSLDLTQTSIPVNMHTHHIPADTVPMRGVSTTPRILVGFDVIVLILICVFAQIKALGVRDPNLDLRHRRNIKALGVCDPILILFRLGLGSSWFLSSWSCFGFVLVLHRRRKSRHLG